MKTIDSKKFLDMFGAGCQQITDSCDYINELNVFPVPDGDTGTNLKITTNSAYESTLQKISDNSTFVEITSILSRQLLMNARGNSGVIFSQIFRGFFDSIKEENNKLDCDLLKKCLISAKERAYRSITNPIEGTILTIIRVISEEMQNKNIDDIEHFFKEVVSVGFDILKKTPDMLISLKEAKVVDSGGYGLCKFFEGMYLCVSGSLVTDKSNEKLKKDESDIKDITINSKNTFINNQSRSEISEEGFGYCCEFIIQQNFVTYDGQKEKEKFNKNSFEKELLAFGDSLIVVTDDDIIKVHMHALEPYKVLLVGQKYGEFLKIKVENMTQQYLDTHPEINPKDIFKTTKLIDDVKLVVTLPSQKISEYYLEELNIENSIITEDTGNPSTNDILNSIKDTKSKNVIVVTDDSNIILSAEQTVELLKNKVNVSIVKGKNLMESMLACLNFNTSWSIYENEKQMNKVVKKSITGLISKSVKTAKFNDVMVQKGDNIGILDKKIVLSDKSTESAAISLIKKMKAKIRKPEMVYLIYGQGISLREVRNIEKFVNENYGIKIKAVSGNQKLYQYYIGIM